MHCPKLHNYLRAHRKRCGLSQAEVAFLVGCKSGAKISGYERRGRLPSLKTLFAFEAIYDAPARHLFAGFAETVEQEVLGRKRELTRAWFARPKAANSAERHQARKAPPNPHHL